MLRNKISGTIMPFSFLAGIVPNFSFGSQSAKLYFWQPKPLLAVGTRELVAFILGSIFLSVKGVFGRILPKIKDGTISAKNKSWQSHCFWHVQIVTHFVEGQHAKSKPPIILTDSILVCTTNIQPNTPHHTSTPPIPPPCRNAPHGGGTATTTTSATFIMLVPISCLTHGTS
jgi:hypothetical protein